MHIFDWENFIFFFPKVIKALPVTLQITLVSTLIGTILGLIISVVRIEKIPLLNQILIVFSSFFRGTSILIQIFLVFFGLPVLLEALGIDNISIDQMSAIYIAYGLNLGAFLSETFRSAVQGVSTTQMEAALSLGYSRWQAYRNIIIPQAVKIAIPDYGIKIVGLLQDTAVAFTIGIIDMMGIVKSLSVMVSSQIEGYFAASLVFLVLSGFLSLFFSFVSKRLSY